MTERPSVTLCLARCLPPGVVKSARGRLIAKGDYGVYFGGGPPG